MMRKPYQSCVLTFRIALWAAQGNIKQGQEQQMCCLLERAKVLKCQGLLSLSIYWKPRARGARKRHPKLCPRERSSFDFTEAKLQVQLPYVAQGHINLGGHAQFLPTISLVYGQCCRPSVGPRYSKGQGERGHGAPQKVQLGNLDARLLLLRN